ncbi:Endonuclease/exonuclease/phosphatase [Gracilaria domingensis]|nr:Endonuclease/exonuclease/phosphatase [Gracilaria domingensis]
MRVGTFNVRGLANSEAEVHRAWEFLGLDFLCVVETWQRPSDEVSLALPHVSVALEADHRTRSPRGGITIFHRERLATKVLAKYATPSYQILALGVRPDLNVVGVYLSLRASDVEVTDFLDQLKSLIRGPTLLLGDWNARHDDWDRRRNKLGRRIRAWIRK